LALLAGVLFWLLFAGLLPLLLLVGVPFLPFGERLVAGGMTLSDRGDSGFFGEALLLPGVGGLA